jgi:hypothetical protein
MFIDDIVPVLGKQRAKIPENLTKKVADAQKQVQGLLKKNKKYIIAAPIVVGATTIAAYLASVLYTTKLQVQSSRIARWQSRENLKDPKNFVQYTEDQVAQAQENVNHKPEEKGGFLGLFKKGPKRKDNISIFKTIKTVTRDNKKYKEWKKIDDVTDDRVKRALTPEEIEQAKKDKEVIQRITRKINNKAEDYSENMETAAGVILGSSILGGALMAKVVPWVVEKTGVANLISKAIVARNGGSESVKILKQLKDKTPGSPDYKETMILLEESIRKFRESKVAKNLHSTIAKEDIAVKFTKYVASNKGVGKIVKMITAPAIVIAGIVISLKLQKQAARAGRFSAKQELLNNPQEFIGYNEQDFESVKEIKAPKKSTSQKLKEYLTFLPRVFKQSRDYNKFKNTEYKKQEALREELIKLDITDEQMLDAKNLQKNLFTTFEEVDDKSQEYSEHMEAANEIAQQGITAGMQFIPIGLLATAGVAIATGKLTTSKALDKTLGFLAKHTKILKTKLFGKYLDEVAQNGEKLVSRQIAYFGTPLQDLMQKSGLGGITFGQTFEEIAEKMAKNRGKFEEYVNNADKQDLEKVMHEIRKMFGDKIPESEKSMSFLYPYNKEEYKQTMLSLYDQAQMYMTKGGKQKFDINLLASKAKQGLQHLLPDTDLSIKGAKEQIDKMDEKEVKKMVEFLEELVQSKISSVRLGNIDKAYLTRMLDSISKISGNIPKEKLQKIMTSIANAGLAEPDKFLQLLNNPGQFNEIFVTPMVVKAGIGVGVAGIGVSYAISSYFAKLQKEAGRLGVMKAMEELKDPKFYANTYTAEDLKKEKKTA